MGEVLPFPKKKKMVPFQQLAIKERDAVLSILRDKGLATYVGILDGSRYVSVFDSKGEPYFIGREEAVWCLFGPDEKMLAESPYFEQVIDALEATLKLAPDVQA